MVGDLFKRVVNVAVAGLAGITFFLVPMGEKTLFQHAVAVFTSAPAREAGAAVAEAGRRVVDVVQGEARKHLPEREAPQRDPGR